MRGPGAKLLLFILVVINAVLIAEAVRHHHDAGQTAALQTATQPTPSTVTPGSDDLPRLTVDAENARSTYTTVGHQVVAWDEDHAWVASVGCDVAAKLSATTDGVKWSIVQLPLPRLLTLDMTGPRAGWIVGSNIACQQPERYRTSNAGRTWTREAGLGQPWLATTIGIRLPSGALSTPCSRTHAQVRALSAPDTLHAIVICTTGVFRTANGGASWSPAGKVARGQVDGVVLDARGRGALFMTATKGCNGSRVFPTSNGGRTWSAGECLFASPPLIAGIGPSGGGLLITTAGVYQTHDDGATWT